MVLHQTSGCEFENQAIAPAFTTYDTHTRTYIHTHRLLSKIELDDIADIP